MQMHHRAVPRALLVHREMQKALLRRLIAGKELAVPVELGEPRRIEPAEVRPGRRQQPAVVELRADIAGRAVREAAVVDRAPEAARSLPGASIPRHGIIPSAFSKKSGAPKFPLSARERGAAAGPMLIVHGTPGSICGPIASASTPSAFTTAPEVSPPATTNRRTPLATSARAICAKRLLDQLRGLFLSELLLHLRDLGRLGAGVDQERPTGVERFADRRERPRRHPCRIDIAEHVEGVGGMALRHDPDLLARRRRAAASEHRGFPARRLEGGRIGARGDEPGGEVVLRQPERDDPSRRSPARGSRTPRRSR